jgi:spore maturation protein CgeB
VSSLDLREPFGATPVLWQLFKGFYEIGIELVIIPYSGHSIDTLWWRTYPNPTQTEASIFSFFKSKIKSKDFDLGKNSLIPKLAQSITAPKWKKHIKKILTDEKDIDAVLLIGVPLNHFVGLPSLIKKEFGGMPTFFYDVDLPTSLPENDGFSFNYYTNSDLSEYSGLIITSEGSISRIKELGARSIDVVHFGVDPEIYSPLEIEQKTDIFFYGNGSPDREENFEMMMRKPSKLLAKNSFYISGKNMPNDVGNCKVTNNLTFSILRKMCCQSKINLNMPRKSHASVYCTSTVRPFELASLGCCVVSGPYDGLEKWFEIGKEMFKVESSKDAVDLYQNLLDDDETRHKYGIAARSRVLKEHTHRHRALQIKKIIGKSDDI